jgi:hypothetical protein
VSEVAGYQRSESLRREGTSAEAVLCGSVHSDVRNDDARRAPLASLQVCAF